MKGIWIVIAVAMVGVVALEGTAWARNPHCAGGIQYVVQAMRDRDRGNMEDYEREITKAVQQLEVCVVEDPKDLEALGYLGWAYAEVDSACAAGRAFKDSYEGLTEKGDKKKAKWVTNNQESYWATKFNEGIGKINSAQETYPNFAAEPQTEADRTLKEEAAKRYQEAITSLEHASCLKPGDARTIRNLGTVYAFMGRFGEAEKVLEDALAIAPNDSDIVAAMQSVRSNAAQNLVAEKRYDEAIDYFKGLVARDDGNADLWMGLADAYFKRAQSQQGDARKPDFKAAGDAYARAGGLRADNADLPFNAALGYQNAGEYERAEVQWRSAIERRPEDTDALSALGATLAELQKFDDAIEAVWNAVRLDPKNKLRHRQLGAVYTKAGNNPKATEELMVYLAMQNGAPVPDVKAETDKAGPAGKKFLDTNGAPEDVYLWEADGQQYVTWFYWSKGLAQHFQGGRQVQQSDWSAASLKTTSSK